MYVKRIALALLFVVVIQGVFFALLPPLFPEQYGAFFEILRPDLQSAPNLMAIAVGYLVTISLACFIFMKAYQNKGLAEGARFGLVMGSLLASAEWFHSIILPLPLDFAVITVIDTIIVWFFSGIVLAFFLKPK